MKNSNYFQRDHFYSRREIHEILGGDLESYLPHVGGKVVCGCFTEELNPDAPYEITFGDGENVVEYAKILDDQEEPIPVFIKRRPNEWEFVGMFKSCKLTTDPKILAAKNINAPRPVVGVLYLEEVQVP